jgi:hypothetical protein
MEGKVTPNFYVISISFYRVIATYGLVYARVYLAAIATNIHYLSSDYRRFIYNKPKTINTHQHRFYYHAEI